MLLTSPGLKIKTGESKLSNNVLSISELKDEMQYHKIEANYIFKKFLHANSAVPIVNDQNSNFAGTSAVDTIFNNDEAYQMYTLKQITYGKKVTGNYKMKGCGPNDPNNAKDKIEQVKPIKKASLHENTFLRAIESIPKIHRPVFEPPCPWLEQRLYVENLCAPGTPWEDIASVIRDHFVYLANDLCIFYTSQSHFIFTIIKVEAYNTMRLLSLPAIQDYNSGLSKELLKNLFSLITQNLNESSVAFQEMREVSKDLIWNYYRFPSPHARSLKDAIRDTPKILYYSLWLNDDLIPGISKRKIDSRFVRIERTFHCKIIFRRNLAALSSDAAQKINETLMELYFDFHRGQFALAIANINKLIRQNESRIYRDLTAYQTIVSCVSKEFFCCEEVASLIEREYIMDDMSYHFIQLMHWLKSQRIGHYVFG